MKFILLAAIAVTMPAMAQENPSTQSTPAQSAGDPPGGYAPPPAPPPDVAFPPPAPLTSYPPCKRGQFDKCVQRHDPK